MVGGNDVTADTGLRVGTGAVDTGVVHVDVELDLATLPALRDRVQRALTARPRTLVLDLSGCGFVGVDGIEALAALTSDADQRGTALLVVGLRPSAWRMARMLGLGNRLHTVPAPVLRESPA